MKKLAILMVLALEFAVCGCGNNIPTNIVNTNTTNSIWQAQLVGSDISGLSFNTEFSVEDTGPLDIIGFSFFNNTGTCFSTAVDSETETGNATLVTSSTGAVTGSMIYTVTSVDTNNVLALTSTSLNGTSNGTTTTTGTLSNGVVAGTWSLSGPCTNGATVVGTFIMCQGTATCTVP